MIQLFSGPLSLFARKIELALVEKGLPFDRILVAFTQTQGYSPKHPGVLAVNPKGQVPVLIDGDLQLYDSTVILEYLEDAYPDPALYPAAAADRARCRLLELFADEIMLVPLRALMHRTEPRADQAPGWAASEAAARQAAERLLQQFGTLETQLAGRPGFCGTVGVADIAVFMAVHYSQRLGGPSLAEHPALRDWYRRLCRRPAFATVIAEIHAADRELSSPVAGAYPDADFGDGGIAG